MNINYQENVDYDYNCSNEDVNEQEFYNDEDRVNELFYQYINSKNQQSYYNNNYSDDNVSGNDSFGIENNSDEERDVYSNN
jgi:hypothetical protein